MNFMKHVESRFIIVFHRNFVLKTLRKDVNFITTPIFYVNAAPHIGHLYSAVLADVIYRTRKLLVRSNDNSIFSTGTDEHGLKIQQAALIDGLQPQEFCNSVSNKFKDLFQLANISYTDYIRTTESRHKEVVHKFWETLFAKGHIYKGKYEGWYCVSDEAFLKSQQIVELPDKRKVSAESKQPVEWMEEENYMFQLSHFEKDILHWLSFETVKPLRFGEIVRKMISDGMQDLSVSRQKSRLSWGIPVPKDETQMIYVWLDALVNYLTVSGYPEKGFSWPPVHIIGKDILKFHALYWPAFLIAADLEPPKEIICHCHWLVDNEKMSKSKGNVIDPFSQIQKVTSEGLRYYLMRDSVPHCDGSFNTRKMRYILNSELANTLGNLLTRSTAPSNNQKQTYPDVLLDAFKETCGDEGQALVEEVRALPAQIEQQFLEGNVYRGLEILMACVRSCNAFYTTMEPWNLIKADPNSAALQNVLHVTYETLRVCGILLQPVVPILSSELLDKLSVRRDERSWSNLTPFPSFSGGQHFAKDRSLREGRCILFNKLKE